MPARVLYFRIRSLSSQGGYQGREQAKLKPPHSGELTSTSFTMLLSEIMCRSKISICIHMNILHVNTHTYKILGSMVTFSHLPGMHFLLFLLTVHTLSHVSVVPSVSSHVLKIVYSLYVYGCFAFTYDCTTLAVPGPQGG